MSKDDDKNRHSLVPVYLSLPVFNELRRYTVENKHPHYSDAVKELLDKLKGN